MSQKIPDGAQPIDMDRAQQHFADLLNQSRPGRGLIINTNNPKTLDAGMRTKHAILHVLSTNIWLTTFEIGGLLEKLSYRRSQSSIRRGLARLLMFGLADRDYGKHRYGRKKWKLTQAGLQYPNLPQARQATTIGTPTSSVMSSGKATTMCIDASKITLNSAIESIVKDLLLTKKAFSAHDVTKILRERISTLNIDPSETGASHVGGQDVAKIEHGYIRDAVHELYHQQKMGGYTRAHNGTFWLYELAQPVVIPSPIASPSDPDPTPSSGNYDGSPVL
jgi:hypothetical protein